MDSCPHCSYQPHLVKEDGDLGCLMALNKSFEFPFSESVAGQCAVQCESEWHNFFVPEYNLCVHSTKQTHTTPASVPWECYPSAFSRPASLQPWLITSRKLEKLFPLWGGGWGNSLIPFLLSRYGLNCVSYLEAGNHHLFYSSLKLRGFM